MSERYNPGAVPFTYDANFIQEELWKIRMVIDSLAHGEMYNAEPNKIWEGMIVRADGTNWNPGGGAGTYIRDTSSWVKLS